MTKPKKAPKPPWYDDSLLALAERMGPHKVTKADIDRWGPDSLARNVLGVGNWLGAVIGTADNLILEDKVSDPVALHDFQEALLETAAVSIWLYAMTTRYVNYALTPKVHPRQMSFLGPNDGSENIAG